MRNEKTSFMNIGHSLMNSIFGALICACLLSIVFPAPAKAEDVKVASAKVNVEPEFAAKVRAWLLDNPDIIDEMLEVKSERQRKMEFRLSREARLARKADLYGGAGTFFVGMKAGDKGEVNVAAIFAYENCHAQKTPAKDCMRQVRQLGDTAKYIVAMKPIAYDEISAHAAKTVLAASRQSNAAAVGVHAALLDLAATDKWSVDGINEAMKKVSAVKYDQLVTDRAGVEVSEALTLNSQLTAELAVFALPSVFSGTAAIIIPGGGFQANEAVILSLIEDGKKPFNFE